MSSKTHLAPELLKRIFYLLPPATQLVCLSVCKSWHTSAKQIYFSHISLLSKTNLSQLISSLQTTGEFVRSLTINTNKQLTYQGCIHLLTLCPFLLQLKLDTVYFEWIWLSGLELSGLKTVLIGDVSWRLGRNNQYFYHVAYRHRGFIEDLHIPCTCDQVLQQEFDGIIQYLSRFKNLKHLKLINGSQSVPVYFDTLLNTCKTLEKLVIELGHPLYPPTTTTTINKQKTVYKSMRQLEIFLTVFSIGYLQYIIDRLVNITALCVCINQSTLDWERDKQEICFFMQQIYIPFIKTLSQSSLTIKMNGSSTMGDLSAQFCFNIDEIKSARFQIDHGRSERTDIKLQTENGHTRLSFLFVRNLSQGSDLPFMTHLQKYGHCIKSLELDMSKNTTPLLSLNFNLIMQHCRGLEKIYISTEQKYPNEQFLTNIQISNTDNVYAKVSNVTINGGMITPHFIHYVSSQLYHLSELHLIKCSLLFDTKETVFDMSELSFLDLIVLDAQYLYKSSCQYTCFILTKVHCHISKHYLLDHVTGLIHIHKSFNILPNANTIKFVFNKSITMEIHAGKTAFKRNLNLITFP